MEQQCGNPADSLAVVASAVAQGGSADTEGSLEYQVVALHKPRGVTVEQASPASSTSGTVRKRKLNDWLREAEGQLQKTASEGCPVGRLNAVGRLDKDTSGLLLLTNDGQLHERILRPGLLEKVYEATIKRPAPAAVTKAELSQLTDGMELSDGFARASSAELVEESTCTVSQVPRLLNKVRGRQQRSGRPQQDRQNEEKGAPQKLTKKAKWMEKTHTSDPNAAAKAFAKVGQLQCLVCASLEHRKADCPHRGATCTKCQRQGHTSEACWRTTTAADAVAEQPSNHSPDPLVEPPPEPFEKSTTISVVRVTVAIGRNRVVRRLLAAAGLPVFGLHRVQIGPLKLLRDLELDESQMALLSPSQEQALRRACGDSESGSTSLEDPGSSWKARHNNISNDADGHQTSAEAAASDSIETEPQTSGTLPVQ